MLRDDDRFLCSIEDFEQWADGRKQLRMEYFYREMRRKHSILMEDNEPIGGQWNLDAENRKPPSNDLDIPDTYKAQPDAITQEVMAHVEKYFPDHFGDLEPFHYAVTVARNTAHMTIKNDCASLASRHLCQAKEIAMITQWLKPSSKLSKLSLFGGASGKVAKM